MNTQAIEKDYRLDQKRHQWSQFSSDLKNILAWLDTAETIVKPQTAAPPDIKELEAAILKHKVKVRHSLVDVKEYHWYFVIIGFHPAL